MRNFFRRSYANVQGGLFESVEKADVGDGAIKMMERGVTLLCWADPFFPDPSTPEFIAKTAAEVISAGLDTHYTMPIGSIGLRKKIADRLNKRGYALRHDRNILITPGSDSGLFFAMFPFIEPGDEVICHDPCYPNNLQNVSLMGGVLKSVPLDRERGWRLDAAAVGAAVTEKTRMVVLTNPNNPTSTVFSRSEIEELCRVIVRHDLMLVVDQAFEDIVFDSREMVEAALMPGMWERTLTVRSVSKGMGLSGYRVGYITACDEIMDRLYGSAVTVIGAANTLSQICAEKAFEDESFMDSYREIFDRRRRYLHSSFNSVPGVKMDMPQSSFIAFGDVSALGSSSEIVALLADKAKCLVNDGANYGKQGEGFIRIVFGCLKDDKQFFAAVDRMAETLREKAGR